MADHLEITPHLTKSSFDEKVTSTFLGQVHFAGTGPEGKTCRECLFFKYFFKGRIMPYEYYSSGSKATARQLKKCRCTYPMPHKAKRSFPHYARSCRLFEQSDNPPPSINPNSD